MSRVMELQAWRPGAMRAASSPDSRGMVTGGRIVAVQSGPETSPAWDPYEVWLTRVKQPRDKTENGSSR